MRQNKKDQMYAQIQEHGDKLNRIFNTGLDAVQLCKKLRSLEVKAHKLSTDYCNGENGIDSENWDDKCQPIIKQVKKILNCTDSFPIFINGDARGYALKIRAQEAEKLDIYKDWGGYGILAPDFS